MGRHKKPVEQISKAAIRKRAQRALSLNGASCSKCGSKTFLDRHHNDYSKPEQVTVLCRTCHRHEDMADGTWAPALVQPSKCKVCQQSFQPVRSCRSTLCGNPACLTQHGKSSAEKRWRGEHIDFGKVATESFRSAQQQLLSNFFDEQALPERKKA